ncbi:MAG: Thymidylate synthase [Alphaproteobacteria bacterium ADurb.Bin438]|nr:MAG: Thymidylate synthase [Alphaproteobacteria bacterium ADurb.Bin438]
MNELDNQYKKIIKDILDNGLPKQNTISVTGTMIKHNMADGFPIITSKFVPIKTVATELEFFIKGLNKKNWLKERKCNIWNGWCNPKKVPIKLRKNSDKLKEFQAKENDLGEIYGYQWNNFDKPLNKLKYHFRRLFLRDKFINQIDYVLSELKNNPSSRRLMVSAWNPNRIEHMALPPCTFAWQASVRGDFIDLVWYQRSCDVFLGLPFDIASHGVLLQLLANESGYKVGTLTGFLADTHIYNNHLDQAKQLIELPSYPLPTLKIEEGFDKVRTFEASKISVENYQHGPKISAEVSVNQPIFNMKDKK